MFPAEGKLQCNKGMYRNMSVKRLKINKSIFVTQSNGFMRKSEIKVRKRVCRRQHICWSDKKSAL